MIDVVNMFTNMDANTSVQSHDAVYEHEYEYEICIFLVCIFMSILVLSSDWVDEFCSLQTT